MIACNVRGDDLTIDVGHPVVKDGRAGDGGMIGDISKRLGRHRYLLGETLCQRLLLLTQNVDGKSAAVRYKFMRRASVQYADEHERRMKRDGGKGIGGHPVDQVAVTNGDDGDTRRKAAHDLAKMKWINVHTTSLGLSVFASIAGEHALKLHPQTAGNRKPRSRVSSL